MKNYSPAKLALAAAAALLLAACGPHASSGYQGYLEGEFVYVAAPLAGQLEKLSVSRGTRVEAGAPLFALEQSADVSTLREAAERLRQSQARLADLGKGSRPSELAALEARLAQARTAADLSARELEVLDLLCDGLIAKEVADRLGVSIRTVESHRTRIYRKLHVRTSVELVRYAIHHGLIDPLMKPKG